ncbi:MAG: phasin family protein [Alteripontixanthobacter sp.]
MATATDQNVKADADAQKAYEKAAAEVKAVAVPKPAEKVIDEEPKGAVKNVTAETPAAKNAPVKKPAAKQAAPKKAAAKTSKKKTPAKRRKPATSKLAVATANITKKSTKKDTKTMANTKNTAAKKADAKKIETVAADLTSSVKEAAQDAQARLKSVYATGSEVASEAVEFTKGNVEAFVESGKILAAGVQDMGRDAVENSKTVVETVTADAKAFAAVRSPTDLFKLQGEIARRNFDTMVSMSSKNTEKMVKLANDSFAPISNRISVAAEKVSKAA